MGLAASQGTLMFISSQQSDVEFAIQGLAQNLMTLANNASIFASQPGLSEQAQTQAQNQFHIADKAIQAQMLTLQTRQKMLSTQYDSIKKTIEENIKRSFNFNA